MTNPAGSSTGENPSGVGRQGRGLLWPVQRYYGVCARPQTYLNLLYLVLGLPLGIAYFVSLVTFISVSAGLAITLVGIPLLVVAMYYWCVVAQVERAQSNVLLGTRINSLQFGPRTGRFWERNGIKARLKSGLTWRSLIWLLFRFPQGVATFVLAVVLVSVPLWMITLPLTATLGGGADFGVWQIDTVQKGMIFVVPGLLLLPLCLYVCNGAARISGTVTTLFLNSPGADGETASVDKALAAAVAWRGLSLGRMASPDAAHEQTIQLRVFSVHAGFFAVVSLGLLLLNGLTTPGVWWAIWPIWGLAIAFGMHAGYLARGLFGLH
ncbi:MAG: sensor domain-containing protein, partial [Tepidiformaceae bacterium]